LPIMDARYRALQANGVITANPYTAVQSGPNVTIPNFMTQRRNNINGQIPNANLAVTTTNSITTSNNLVTISGTAPVLVKAIRVNGIDYKVTWTSVTAWTLRLVVDGNVTLNITGVDVHGNVITTTQTVNIVYTGPSTSPLGAVVFNEIMYNPAIPGASFVEIYNTSPTVTFDLSNWRVNGIDFTFPPGSIITNRQIIVLAANHGAFIRTYGSTVPVFGEFAGNLDNGGETLSLIAPGDAPGEEIVIDRVRYEPVEPWAVTANGRGASLQLIDAAQDNSRPSNWSDGSGWKFFSFTGNMTAMTNQLRVYLNIAGQIYVDDLWLVAGTTPETGANLILNGDFEGPFLTNDGGPWLFSQPSLSNTVISTEVKHMGTGSLKLVHALPGPTSFLIQNDVIVPAAGQHTLSFWYLPIATNATLTTYVNGFYRPSANVRSVLSSPGAANPTAAALPPYPPLWLNELQPNNVNGIRDASNTPEPWLELYNAGTNALSLDGLYLANNYVSNLTQWAFPPSITLAPGEFKIVWLDGDPGQSSGTNLHTSFRLHPSSGTVALVRMVGDEPQIMDYLTYNNIGPNLAYGDYPDGQPFYRSTLYTVTPGSTNVSRPGAVFINEWLAGNQTGLVDPADGDREDWFELFNPNEYAVDLGGYYLSDTLTNKTQFRIPNGYTVPAQGHLLVWADNESGQNNTNNVDLHASFALSRSGESIALFAPDGTMIDGITFGGQTNDVSQGRFPDGSANLYFMNMLTPRAANRVLGLDNTPPVLSFMGDRTIDEGRRFTYQASASDADFPIQTLTYSLDAGAPAGAIISSGGELRWAPSEAQGPGVYSLTVRVTDDGSPAQSDSETINVTVREVNRAPWFTNTQEKHVKAGDTLSFLTGFDNDIPANALAFSLAPGAPAGLSVHPATGQLSWTPAAGQAPGNYLVTVEALDNGVPPLGGSHTYRVYVYESSATVVVVQMAREGNNVRLSWPASPMAQYQVQFKDTLDASWQPHPTAVTVVGDTASLVDPAPPGQRFYRVRIQ
ncbi:MAG: lamin tail domain-containing protein, partial [Phycisphaerales bacterium]|nr:lamin tail domain-containing protein [Phycisphaerales bacterium]